MNVPEPGGPRKIPRRPAGLPFPAGGDPQRRGALRGGTAKNKDRMNTEHFSIHAVFLSGAREGTRRTCFLQIIDYF